MPKWNMRVGFDRKSLSAICLAAVWAVCAAPAPPAFAGEAPPKRKTDTKTKRPVPPAFAGKAPPRKHPAGPAKKREAEPGKKEAGQDGEEGGEKEDEVEEFAADLIILKSDVGIEGKVIRQTEDAVKVEVDAGTFWILKGSIKRIDLNLASRLAELDEDDYAGRYALAVQALEMGQTTRARPVLDELVGKPGVPADIYKTLAGMLEEEGDIEKALDYLKRYEMSNPGDKELKEKIAELKKELGSSGGKAAGGAAAVNEGMEVGGTWSALNWGNPVKVGLQDLEGNKALMLEVAPGGRDDKAAVGRYVRLDLRDKARFRFRAFNAEKRPVQLALAIITSTFYESRPLRLRRDWNTGLSIDLRAKKFKCRETNWRYEAGIDDIEKVEQFIFLVYSGRRKALLYLDSIRAE